MCIIVARIQEMPTAHKSPELENSLSYCKHLMQKNIFAPLGTRNDPMPVRNLPSINQTLPSVRKLPAIFSMLQAWVKQISYVVKSDPANSNSQIL